MLRVGCLSDTHNQLEKVADPECDLLVHAGDLTNRGTVQELSHELYELGRKAKLTRLKKGIFICGNHDWLGEKEPEILRGLAEDNGLVWLQDSGAVLDPDGNLYPWDPQKDMPGVKFWGAAWTPEFGGWAFNLDRYDGSLEEAWARIPEAVDVLITHGPPKGILDLVDDRRVGCFALRDRVLVLRPKLHVFGHIHWSSGEQFFEGTHFVNAAICDERYSPGNPVRVAELFVQRPAWVRPGIVEAEVRADGSVSFRVPDGVELDELMAAFGGGEAPFAWMVDPSISWRP